MSYDEDQAYKAGQVDEFDNEDFEVQDQDDSYLTEELKMIFPMMTARQVQNFYTVQATALDKGFITLQEYEKSTYKSF